MTGRPLLLAGRESEVARKYHDGVGLEELADSLSVSATAVRNALHKVGEPIRPKGRTLTGKPPVRSGSENGSWTGDKASYNARHQRVKLARGKATGPCSHCHTLEPYYRFEWAQIHGTDGMSSEDYISLCRLCHEEYDAEVLSREQVQEIKALKYFGTSKSRLAEMYGITEHYVYCIVSGRSRKAPVPHCEMS